MTGTFHPFHMVGANPWPLTTGMAALVLTSSTVLAFKTKSWTLFMVSFIILLTLMTVWWRDCIRESTLQGAHNIMVMNGLKYGMILFIFSEVLFFFAFFWTFLHCSTSVTPEIGMNWPPFELYALSPFQIPILNTLILLSSGVTVTVAHHQKLNNDNMTAMMIWTVVLGVYFTSLQVFEYINSSFSFSDSSMGSVFFMATGFHGAHVMIGTTFLIIQTARSIMMQLNNIHHIGFELAIWYWHFVDVVWLFLFSLVYWWGL